MCGILGIAGKFSLNELESLHASVVHRGPDKGGGVYTSLNHEVGLAMQRLAIIDLDDGNQPFCNEDRSIILVFNGEIFNAPELRSELQAKGVSFRSSHSDTEVILRLYEKEGIDSFHKLNGMFAFVIHDSSKNFLTGARDRFGIKPLYYGFLGDRFVFSSELKSFGELSDFNSEINQQSLWHYFSLQHIPGKDSIFSQIKRLPPASYFKYDLENKDLKISPYWCIPTAQETGRSIGEVSEELRSRITTAVKRWSNSDVDMGFALSGGIDSAIMVGLGAQLSPERIKTYCLGFDSSNDSKIDERQLALEVSRKWNTEHREIIIKPDDLLNDLVNMIWSLDEPYAGGLPSWFVFKEMSKDVKVAITGSGGDELFGNYGKFRIFEKKYLLQLKLFLNRTFDLKGTPFGANYHSLRRYFRHNEKLDFLLASDQEICSTEAFLQDSFNSLGCNNIRDKIASIDLHGQLPDEFLLMTDRFSMAHSLEARVPLLDNELFDFVFSIPADQRTNYKDVKYLLKKSMHDLFPDSVLNLPKKGFVLPVNRWLKGKLKPHLKFFFDPRYLKEQEIFQPNLYKNLIVPFLDGRPIGATKVWTLLMFQLWYSVFINNKSQSPPSYTLRDLVS